MSNIAEKLQLLEPGDLDKVEKLINKLAARRESNIKKYNESDKSLTQNKKKKSKPTSKPTPKPPPIIEPGHNTSPLVTVGPVRASSKNLFESMPEFNKFKKDTQLDKLLSGNNEITERRSAQKQIETNCEICRKSFKVYPSMLKKSVDPQSATWTYTCNRCSTKPRYDDER